MRLPSSSSHSVKAPVSVILSYFTKAHLRVWRTKPSQGRANFVLLWPSGCEFLDSWGMLSLIFCLLTHIHWVCLLFLVFFYFWGGCFFKGSLYIQIMFTISPVSIIILTSSHTMLSNITLFQPYGPPWCPLSVLGMLYLPLYTGCSLSSSDTCAPSLTSLNILFKCQLFRLNFLTTPFKTGPFPHSVLLYPPFLLYLLYTEQCLIWRRDSINVLNKLMNSSSLWLNDIFGSQSQFRSACASLALLLPLKHFPFLLSSFLLASLRSSPLWLAEAKKKTAFLECSEIARNGYMFWINSFLL